MFKTALSAISKLLYIQGFKGNARFKVIKYFSKKVIGLPSQVRQNQVTQKVDYDEVFTQ